MGDIMPAEVMSVHPTRAVGGSRAARLDARPASNRLVEFGVAGSAKMSSCCLQCLHAQR